MSTNSPAASPAVTIDRTGGGPEQSISFCFATREGRLLYPRDDSAMSLLAQLFKADTDAVAPSNQGVAKGCKRHPFDFCAAERFKLNNVHHSTCIQAAKQALVGLGFVNEKVPETLDPLCEISFQDTMGDVAEDFLDVGNGFLEIVREKPDGKITGIHHIPAKDVDIYIEDQLYNRHYRIKTSSGEVGYYGNIFARFGEGAELLVRLKDNLKDKTNVSEVIHFRQSSNLNRWYGMPRWLAATASIELMQALHQFSFDFFINRGVPEFILVIKGGKMAKPDWDKVEQALKANIGTGNSHKTMALNLTDPNMDVVVEKLAMEGTGDSTMLKDMSETLALSIVSAHGVPPLLAGILIPGKLGSANELPNALQSFQALVVGPMQTCVSTTLGVSLGDPKYNGGLGLVKGDFKLKKITEELDLGQMDTVSRMKQPLATAQAQGRDLSAGLKKAVEKHGASNIIGMVLGEALAKMEQAEGS
jgi:hypothetical protein